MCTSTVRVSPGKSVPQTSSSSASRVSTTPGSRASATSRSNSRGTEREPTLPDVRVAAAWVYPQRPDFEWAAAPRRGIGTAQHGLDSRHERPRVERLRDVVVGAELEPDDRIDVVASRGEHDHGRLAAPADLAADLEPITLGQHQVEDHQVWIVARIQRERLLAITRRDDAEPLLLEVEPQQVDDVPLVVDDQDRFHRREDTPDPCAPDRST